MRFEYADSRTPYAMTQGGGVYFLAYDQVGSLRVVADMSGNIVKAIAYDTFGNIIQDTDPAFEVPFGFTGGLHDKDTGLVRFGFRDYDPETGHWTAKDPIGFAGGDTDLYGYCLNDPVNWVDLWGLDREKPLSTGNAVSVGITVSTEAAKAAKIISMTGAIVITGGTAIVGDLISPHEAEGPTLMNAQEWESYQWGVKIGIYDELENAQELQERLDWEAKKLQAEMMFDELRNSSSCGD
ncbi:MAG: RHS repeat-associated core domain-containing protein [Desulfosalsimonadaceae bacterium]